MASSPQQIRFRHDRADGGAGQPGAGGAVHRLGRRGRGRHHGHASRRFAAQIVTFSNNASGGFIKSLGENARGVIVAQVFPFERSMATGFVKQAAELAKAKNVELSPAMIMPGRQR